jgi:putative tricarboxylic transport membrane protein
VESFGFLLQGLGSALSPQNLLFALLGSVLGTLVGVLPGVGPAAGTALLIPMTFVLPAVPAIIMLSAVYYGAMYGGTITSVLLNVPGEAASVVTCIEGYEMAKQGRAGPALSVAAIGSFIGGMLATICLVTVALPLTRAALRFGPPEFFALMCFGLSLVIGLAGKSIVKSLLVALLGLALAQVGMDPTIGLPRFTFGAPDLVGGVELVAMVMGLFGVGDLLVSLERPAQSVTQSKVGQLFPAREDWRRSLPSILRGTAIGTGLGLIPGVASAVPTFVSYVIEKRAASKPPEGWGGGAIEGVAGPETANNAYVNAALIPLFSLGIPSSPTVALLMGAFMINGLIPGPFLFVEHPDVVWTVIASLFIGNVILLVLNLPLIGLWVRVLAIPRGILYALILVFCIVGSYSLNNRLFDPVVMLLFGVLGYALRKLEFPLAPVALTLVLGPLMEKGLAQSMMLSRGDPAIFLTRPIALALLMLSVVVLVVSSVKTLSGVSDAVRQDSQV